MTFFQILIIIVMPFLWIRLTRAWDIASWLSPVVLSYLTGIVLANVPVIPLDTHISTIFSEYTVVLAIPMLLYATNLSAWIKHARSSVLSFALCVLSGIICSFLMAFVFRESIENTWLLSGMLVGVYTGGTPNMNAIGLALEASSETLVLMNAADIFCGGIYLIFLTSLAHPLYSKILPAFRGNKNEGQSAATQKVKFDWLDAFKIIGLTVLIIALTIGLTLLVFGNLKELAFILLLLTSFSIIASLFASVRNLKGSFEMGEYLLLMFCVAIGMQADFSTMLAEGGAIIQYTACVLGATIFLHILFSRMFKIDADTLMITSTAALYGPPFIGQIASTIQNRSLIVSGMATGLVGYAVGNYLGISVAGILKHLLL